MANPQQPQYSLSDLTADNIFTTRTICLLSYSTTFGDFTDLAKHFVFTDFDGFFERLVSLNVGLDVFFKVAENGYLSDSKLKKLLDNIAFTQEQLNSLVSYNESGSEVTEQLLLKGAIPNQDGIYAAIMNRELQVLNLYAKFGFPISTIKPMDKSVWKGIIEDADDDFIELMAEQADMIKLPKDTLKVLKHEAKRKLRVVNVLLTEKKRRIAAKEEPE